MICALLPRLGGLGLARCQRALILALLLVSMGFAAPPVRPAQPGLARLGPALETGLPVIRNFSPKETGGGTQNWAIVQDPRGVIYVGNNDGVLEFDGVRWRLIRVANGTTVRSLAVDTAGRVHVGAIGELGILEPDAAGQMRYVSWLDRLPPAERGFLDVWKTYATPEGIVFATYSRIFRVGSRVEVWKPSVAFHKALQVGERFFVQEVGRGLLELVKGKWQLLPQGERFAGDKVDVLLPGPTPGALLIGTRTQGLFIFNGATVVPFSTAVDPGLKQNLYAGIRLADGTLALGSLLGGLYLLDDQGRLRVRLNKANGLPDDGVLTLFQDRQGGLWIALSKGLARAEVGAPVTVFSDRLGLEGVVHSVHRHAGTLYAGTHQSLFRLGLSPDAQPRFFPLPEIKSQSLAFLDMGATLLVANFSGVYALQAGIPKRVRPSGQPSLSLCRSGLQPARVFVGLQNGLASLRFSQGRWMDEGQLPGITEDIRTLFEEADGRLWLGTFTTGVLRVTFPPGWQGGASAPPARIERFGPADGLPSLTRNGVYGLAKAPLFATHQGFYRFDENARRFTPDPRFLGLFPEGPRWVTALQGDRQGRLWMHAVHEEKNFWEVGAAVPQGNASYRWQPTPPLPLTVASSDEVSTWVDSNNVVWFGRPADGLFRYDPAIAKDLKQPFQALVRRVAARGDQLLFGGAGQAAVPTLKHAENALRFEFAAPSFDGLEANRFQVLLEGVDREWSPWSTETYRDYTNLRERDYRFRVRAKNVFGTLSQEGHFGFRILPPWYRHPVALLLWALLLAGSLVGAFRWRLSALKRRNQELSLVVDRATENLEILNRRLYNLNDAKNRIIGLAAHDLRNPLAGILLHCELLQEEGQKPEVATAAGMIRTLGNNMKELIQRLLDIHAIEAGQAENPSLEPLDLGVLLAVARNHALVVAERKDIHLQLDVAGPAQVLGDPDQIGQILDNFLSNALKFSQPGTTVTLGLTPGAGRWRAFVRDQGPGLTAEDLLQVFGEYARLSARPTAGEASVGLGLSLVKRMAVAMGGAVGVDSALGQGATFWLELPEV